MNKITIIVALAILIIGVAISRRDIVFGATQQTVGKGYTDVTASQLAGMISTKKELVLVDVREPDEYSAGHIANTRLIPLGTIADKANELSKSSEIVLICRSGNRSSRAALILARQGFTKLYNLVGGMGSWTGTVEKGLPK